MSIKPALTPEEWASESAEKGGLILKNWGPMMPDGVGFLEIVAGNPYGCITIPQTNGESRSALAALCLHGQPFGFTREMVDAIRELASNELGNTGDDASDSLYALADGAADRIEALVPPEHGEPS